MSDRDVERDMNAVENVNATHEQRNATFTDPKLINGFARATHFIAHDPDRTTVIYRRFDKFSIRNLLFLEGRVAALERLQDELDEEDFNHRDNRDITTISGSWEDFALLASAKGVDWPKYSALNPNTGIPRYAHTKWRALRLAALRLMKTKMEARNAENAENAETSPELERIKANLLKNEQEKNRNHAEPLNAPQRAANLACDLETLDMIENRWAVAKATVDAVKEYQDALIRYHRLLSLDSPAKRTSLLVFQWMYDFVSKRQGSRGGQFLNSSGMSEIIGRRKEQREAEGNENNVNTEDVRPSKDWLQPDLVSLRPAADEDRVSRGLAKRRWLLEWLKDDKRSDGQLNWTPEAKISQIATFIGLGIAVTFLVLAVWMLYLTERTKYYTKQLAVLTTFVILFGVWVNFFTNAKRYEVFGATAAYAAVLVVFVGNGAKTAGDMTAGKNATASFSFR